MEVKEAKNRLFILQDQILDLIVNFEKETDLHIKYIDIDRKLCFGGDELINISIDAGLKCKGEF